MQENTIRFLVNREFIVIDVSILSSFYGHFFIHEIIEKAGLEASVFDETELGDFDLQGKMSYFPTNLEKLKLTYLDEKAILFKRFESAEVFKKMLTPAILPASLIQKQCRKQMMKTGLERYYVLGNTAVVLFT